jgi:hypothetical protein
MTAHAAPMPLAGRTAQLAAEGASEEGGVGVADGTGHLGHGELGLGLEDLHGARHPHDRQLVAEAL